LGLVKKVRFSGDQISWTEEKEKVKGGVRRALEVPRVPNRKGRGTTHGHEFDKTATKKGGEWQGVEVGQQRQRPREDECNLGVEYRVGVEKTRGTVVKIERESQKLHEKSGKNQKKGHVLPLLPRIGKKKFPPHSLLVKK